MWSSTVSHRVCLLGLSREGIAGRRSLGGPGESGHVSGVAEGNAKGICWKLSHFRATPLGVCEGHIEVGFVDGVIPHADDFLGHSGVSERNETKTSGERRDM